MIVNFKYAEDRTEDFTISYEKEINIRPTVGFWNNSGRQESGRKIYKVLRGHTCQSTHTLEKEQE